MYLLRITGNGVNNFLIHSVLQRYISTGVNNKDVCTARPLQMCEKPYDTWGANGVGETIADLMVKEYIDMGGVFFY
ncbi:MAG: hypothetical protein ABI472_06845 [Ginsengibacter sp.]